MRVCRPKDRLIQHFPKTAFELLPESDPPMVDAITRPDGPGWYPNLLNSEQCYGELYPLLTELPAFDYVHWASARDESCIRKLMLGQKDFLRFAVHCASGEYVPWQKTAKHPDMQRRAVQFHCLQCKMDPCGDHGAHAAHHRKKELSHTGRTAWLAQSWHMSLITWSSSRGNSRVASTPPSLPAQATSDTVWSGLQT